MHPENAAFYTVSGMVLGSALLVVMTRNMIHAIFLFFVTLFAIAGLYVFALADFVAVTQVVVYAGGVLVLMLFAFMLSDKELLNKATRVMAREVVTLQKAGGAVVAIGFIMVLVGVVRSNPVAGIAWLHGSPAFNPSDDTVQALGVSLMTRYLLPFEVISVLLLAALIGAAHLSRKERSA